MNQLLKTVEDSFKSKKVTDVRSGDTVRVSQRIKEGNKERVQLFEGLVINTRRRGSSTFTITVRRIASGVGVEKTYQPHSPLVEKIEVIKRSKVRRNNLSYMRGRSGKSARLASVDFDRDEINFVPDVEDKDAPKIAEDTLPAEAEMESGAEEEAETDKTDKEPAKAAAPTEDKKPAETEEKKEKETPKEKKTTA